jgi:hypothetical protein
MMPVATPLYSFYRVTAHFEVDVFYLPLPRVPEIDCIGDLGVHFPHKAGYPLLAGRLPNPNTSTGSCPWPCPRGGGVGVPASGWRLLPRSSIADQLSGARQP